MNHGDECTRNGTDSLPHLAANQRLSEELQRARSDLRRAEEALELMSRTAECDGLTGLPNRALFADRFKQAAALAHRDGHRMALLFLDLDNFKAINDTRGHQSGDWVLKRTANCLLSTVRESDTVSRYGGDEFLILLSKISQAADATLTSSKIVAALEQLARNDQRQSGLTASIGISLYPEDGTDLDHLIDRADLAMYRSRMQARETLTRGAFAGSMPEPAQYAHPTATVDDDWQALQTQLDRAQHQLVVAATSAEDLRITTENVHRPQGEYLTSLMQKLDESMSRIREALAGIVTPSPARDGLDPSPWHAVAEPRIADERRQLDGRSRSPQADAAAPGVRSADGSL